MRFLMRRRRVCLNLFFLCIIYQGRDIHGRIYLNEKGINAQVTSFCPHPQNKIIHEHSLLPLTAPEA
jgi:hypothetical protein